MFCNLIGYVPPGWCLTYFCRCCDKISSKSNLGYEGFVFAYVEGNTVQMTVENRQAGRGGTGARAGGWQIMLRLYSESRAVNAGCCLAPLLCFPQIVPDPSQGMLPHMVGGSSHLNEHTLDNAQQACPEAHLPCDSRYCPVKKRKKKKTHHSVSLHFSWRQILCILLSSEILI